MAVAALRSVRGLSRKIEIGLRRRRCRLVVSDSRKLRGPRCGMTRHLGPRRFMPAFVQCSLIQVEHLAMGVLNGIATRSLVCRTLEADGESSLRNLISYVSSQRLSLARDLHLVAAHDSASPIRLRPSTMNPTTARLLNVREFMGGNSKMVQATILSAWARFSIIVLDGAALAMGKPALVAGGVSVPYTRYWPVK